GAADRIHQPRQRLLGGRIGGNDPMQLPQERQSGGRLAVEQYEHDREGSLLHAPVERLVIFGDLPGAEPLLADQQRERRGFGDFRRPVAAGTQALRCKEYLGVGILVTQGRLDPLHQRKVLRIVAQEPTPHSHPQPWRHSLPGGATGAQPLQTRLWYSNNGGISILLRPLSRPRRGRSPGSTSMFGGHSRSSQSNLAKGDA